MTTNQRILASLRVILLCAALVILVANHSRAAPTSGTLIQGCTVAPTSTDPTAIMKCPRASVQWLAPAADTRVRIVRDGAQQWATFGSLKPTDSVYAQIDGTWHALNTIIVLTTNTAPTDSGTPPPATPPVTTVPPPTYTVTWQGGGVAAIFTGMPGGTPQCFSIATDRGQTQTVCL